MKIFIISGPSGVGKSHLVHELEKIGINSINVYTDRERRPTEIAVTDRIYMTKDEFNNSLKDFLYWFKFQGNRYGYKTKDINNIKKKALSACLTIPPSYIKEIMKLLPEGFIIHLDVDKENFSLLSDRMKKRDISESESASEKEGKRKNIQRRLEYAHNELHLKKNIQKIISEGSKGRIFTIINDDTLYTEVIPFIINVSRNES